MIRFHDPLQAVAWLRTPQAIRERCRAVYAAAERDDLAHFSLRPERLDAAADYVVDTISLNYPKLAIPYHSRWRHFSAGGKDRWGALLSATLATSAPDAVARASFDLVVVSVLLDAGAGEAWSYREIDGGRYARSEGLGVASLHMFSRGLFSSDAGAPLQADADALASLDEESLASGFQCGPHNPLVGLSGRCELLRRLGSALAADPELFGNDPSRIGHLFDYLVARAGDRRLPAADVLAAVLQGFSSIWPGRVAIGADNLGDVWHHPAAGTDDLTDGLVPFHKLSQWLAYSLVEPLEAAGIEVTGLDALTGLPEYRNGGLLIDFGVLSPKHERVLAGRHTVDSELVVEWRALTVVLLDRLAERVRARLGVNAVELPLAKVLEGGTWSAGRRIAAERRDGGGPPIRVVSDGTVF